jgi:hypothetical protein
MLGTRMIAYHGRQGEGCAGMAVASLSLPCPLPRVRVLALRRRVVQARPIDAC